MTIVYTIVAVAIIVFAVFVTIHGLKRAGAVTQGADTKKAAFEIVGGALLGLVVIVLYLQILAVINGKEAWLFVWVGDILKQLFSGGLPQFGG